MQKFIERAIMLVLAIGFIFMALISLKNEESNKSLQKANKELRDSIKILNSDTVKWITNYPIGTLDREITDICDSLDKYNSPKNYSINAKNYYYDLLTDKVCDKLWNNGESYSYVPTDELLHNKKFVHIMDKGWDGLCNIDINDNPKLFAAISYLLGAYNYAGR